MTFIFRNNSTNNCQKNVNGHSLLSIYSLDFYFSNTESLVTVKALKIALIHAIQCLKGKKAIIL